VYSTCSKKLTGSQLSPPHRTNKKLNCETKNKTMSMIGPVQSKIGPVQSGYRHSFNEIRDLHTPYFSVISIHLEWPWVTLCRLKWVPGESRGSKQAYRVTHQLVFVVSQCSLIAWLNGLASGDQRRLTKAVAHERRLRDNALCVYFTFTLLYFTLLSIQWHEASRDLFAIAEFLVQNFSRNLQKI